MSNLITRVKNHTNGQRTSGQNTLSLTLECIEHMRDHNNEWTALAFLVSLSEPAQSRSVRMIAGSILQGWKIVKDAKQPSGLRFKKDATANQGFSELGLSNLASFIADKKSVQSKEVREYFRPDNAKPEKTHEEKVAAFVKAIQRRMENDGVAWEEVVAGVTAAA